MKNLRKIMRSAFCAAVCAATAVTMSGCKSYTKMIEEHPNEYIAMSAENTAKSVVSGNFAEEYKLLEKALKEGTFSLEFEAEGIRFNGECYINEKDEISSQRYTLTGSKGTSAGVYAYSDNKIVKIGTDGKSGSHVYDIYPDTLADKLASSIFAPGSGSYYELDNEEYEALLQLAGELNSAITKEDTESSYEDIINAYFEEHPPVTEKDTEMSINGETVNANIFRYNIPKDDVYSIVGQLVDEALKNESFSAMADGTSAEDAKKDIMSVLDDYEDYSIGLVYYVNSKSNELMQIDMDIHLAEKQAEIDEDDIFSYYYYNNQAAYDVSLSMVYGADPANAEKQSFLLKIDTDYYDNENYEDSTAAISADITNSENKTEIVIDVTENGESDGTLSVTSERDGDNYTITVSADDGTSAKIEGTVVTDNNSFTMTIDRIALMEGSAEVAYSPKAVITVNAGGEVLALDAEKEFLDITESELDDLIENIGADFEAVLMEFAEDSTLGSSMLNYVQKSKLSSANANAKSAYVAAASQITQMGIDNEPISNEFITGVGSVLTIDDREYDLSNYLGSEFEGYYYVKINPITYSASYAVWSESPIPDEYKIRFSYDELADLAADGIIIGAYPWN